MTIIQPGEGTTVLEKKTMVGKKLISRRDAEIVRLKLGPGDRLPVHTTPVDVSFFVAEGSGEIAVGSETASVSAGALVESPRDIPHGLANPSGETFTVLVIKTPKP